MIDNFFSAIGHRDYSALLDIVLSVADDCKKNCSIELLTVKFKEIQQKSGLSEKDVNLAYFFYIDNILTFEPSADLRGLENEFSEYSKEAAQLMRKLVVCGVITVQQIEELIEKISFFSLEKIGADDLKKIIAAVVFSGVGNDNFYNGNIEVN